MTVYEADQALLTQLEPNVTGLLERHLASAKEWFPHEVVPWSLGKDFEPGQPWSADESTVKLSDEVRSALFVNLLTEDNLPYYFRTIEGLFSPDGAWGEWNRRWTAEEGRHSIAIRDYLTVTRALDPVALERARMAQVSKGEVPAPASVLDGIAYVALQELATRVSHHNTGKQMDDPVGYEVMKRVAADENRHYLFYKNLMSAAIEIDPSASVQAIARQVIHFEMPGTGITDFGTHARAIAKVGIYGFAEHHDQVLKPVLEKQWHLDKIEGLDGEAEIARESALRHMKRVGIAAKRAAKEPKPKVEA